MQIGKGCPFPQADAATYTLAGRMYAGFQLPLGYSEGCLSAWDSLHAVPRSPHTTCGSWGIFSDLEKCGKGEVEECTG